MIRLEQKQKEFLLLLLQQKDPIAISELLLTLQVSRRTIYYIVSKLNDLLFVYGIDPILNKRQTGYYLTQEQKVKIRGLLQTEISIKFLYSTERVYYLICWMMYHISPVHVETIMNVFDISRNSVFNDLKSVKSEIEKYDVSLNFDIKDGYFIKGKTFSQRALLLHYLKLLLKKVYYKNLHFIDPYETELFYNRLLEISENRGNEYDDYDLLSISCLLSIVHHVQEKFDFSILELRDLENAQELKLVDQYFQDFNVHDRLFLTIHLLGSKAGTVLRLDNDEDDIRLFELSLRIVDIFEKQTYINVSDKNELINSLYMHFKLSMYYYRLSIQVNNNLLNEVRINYYNLYHLVEMVCKQLKDDFPFLLTDSEIGYITMHFGGHIQQGKRNFYQSVRVLIVCPSGISTSKLIKREIEGLYSNVNVVDVTTVDNINNYDDIHFIVSTVDLVTNIPWIKVHPILTNEDRSQIASMMLLNFETYDLDNSSLKNFFSILEKYVDESKIEYLKRDIYEYLRQGNAIVNIHYDKPIQMYDLLNVEDIQIIDKEITWKKSIILASQSLVEKNKITTSYQSAMIKLLEDYGPYIILRNKVAIAHASPEKGANVLCISLLINQQPIDFEEDNEVQFLFVLSSPNQEQHLQVLRDIHLVSSHKDFLDNLLNIGKNEIPFEIKKFIVKMQNK